MSFRLSSYSEFLAANPGLDLSATFSRGYSAYTLVRGLSVDGKQQRLGWEAAERKASRLGGNLVTINGAAENQWITSRYAPISFDQCGLWIGLNDLRKNGTWEWSSGERSSYRNWLPAGTPGYRGAEPTNGAGEDYVHIYFNSAAKGRWKDTNVGYRDVALGGGIAEISVARVIRGTDLNDMLLGGGRADRLIGGKGNDTMLGRGGNDDFLGEAGADVLTGGLAEITSSTPLSWTVPREKRSVIESRISMAGQGTGSICPRSPSCRTSLTCKTNPSPQRATGRRR